MLEPGNISDVNSARLTSATYNGTSDSPKPAVTTKIEIADDDAAAAVIQNAHRAGISNVQQKIDNNNIGSASAQTMKDALVATRERLAKLNELVKLLSGGRFSAGALTKQETNTKLIKFEDEDSRAKVYNESSKLLQDIREAMEEIRSFDGFLLGVHDKIEEFKEQTEFSAEQIQDIQKNMTELNTSLEIGIFSLTRVHEEMLKELRGQEEGLDENKALQLLKDIIKSPAEDPAQTSGFSAHTIS
jgi:predicted  nucleic acid-binding Zn-ribbon protein